MIAGIFIGLWIAGFLYCAGKMGFPGALYVMTIGIPIYVFYIIADSFPSRKRK